MAACARNEAEVDGGGASAAARAEEEPVLEAHGNGADGLLRGVVVDGSRRVRIPDTANANEMRPPATSGSGEEERRALHPMVGLSTTPLPT